MAEDREKIIRTFTAEAETATGSALQSVVLYGSGAGGDYRPGRSDLNFLLVAKTVDLPLLDALQRRIGAWAKRRIPTPLVVPPSFLASSTDSYPLEILGMMASYRVLKGSDPFVDLRPEREHVRLQVEREIKAKSLSLRRDYMESCGKHERLLASLTAALPAVEAILRGVLFVREADWRRSGPALHEGCARQVGVDPGCLAAIAAARSGRGRPDRKQVIGLYGETLEMLRQLAGIVEGSTASA
jgi:hypothetical protein